MNILVLSGGLSSEREISLRSALAVKKALLHLGHTIMDYDPALGMDGLHQYVGKVDVVFPVLHGKHGEDGEVQKELEKSQLPFIGSGSAVSKLCFDKMQFNQTVSSLGYTIPHSQKVNWEQFIDSPLSKMPYVLKPNDGGSSIDTLLSTSSDLDGAELLFRKQPTMLLQELIEGDEITVAVLSDRALPVIEIIPPKGEDVDYENKYNGKTEEACPPISVSHELQLAAQHIALEIHQQLGVRHLSRTDMIIDRSGTIFVLELNTIPGLTEASLFPKAALAAGITMPDLMDCLLTLAV